jgi:hypothetical protein
MPPNVIILGQTKIDNINQEITDDFYITIFSEWDV